MVYVANSFSLQMVDPNKSHNIRVTPFSVAEVDVILYDREFVSCIGHVDTAAVVTSMLGKEVPCNRINVKLEKGDVLIVAQLLGGRLPEGATSLPEGFDIKFLHVSLS